MHRRVSRRPLVLAVAGAAAVLVSLAAGCTSTVPGTPTTPSTTPTPTTAEPTTTPPPTTADAPVADGTDLGACSDGECEVRVDGPAEIPVPAGSDVSAIRVEDGDGGGLRIVVENSGGGRSSIGGGGSGIARGPGYLVEIEGVGPRSVVLRITID